ncbi:hypothetical protein PVAR5_0916 [Paecilomyces variotii No. 5]|uniref:MYND-type domain-containing protein n=1 Tax=Byssochlamys spectabilis (strain No. 5 / NBRC 109023) TaxID=1356009 RepID=V5HSC9_BYSSN|nr:hypothetical protein PVAR5_0916 [Paecilomyces variotii No. 5]
MDATSDSEPSGWGHWAFEEDLTAPDAVESTVDVSFRVYVPYRLSPPVDGAPVAFVLDAFTAPLPASRFEPKDRETSVSVFEIESSFNAPVYENEFREETFAFARAILHERSSTKISERKWSCVACSAPASTFVHTAFLRRQILHDEDLLDLSVDDNRNPAICKTCIVVVDVSVPICTNRGEEPCYQGGVELSKKYAHRIMMHKDILVECPRKVMHEPQKSFNNPSDLSQSGMPLFKDCSTCRDAQATFACAACRKVGYCSFECQHEHWPEHKQFCVPSPAHDPDALPLLLSWLIGDNKHHDASLEERQKRYGDLDSQRDRSKWRMHLNEGRYFTFNGNGTLIEADPWADIGIEDRVVDEDARIQYPDDARILLCLKRFGDDDATTERATSTYGNDLMVGCLWQPLRREPECQMPIAQQGLWQPRQRSAQTSGTQTPTCREPAVPGDVAHEETWTSLSLSDMRRS